MEPVEYLRGIRRRWRVILAAVVVGMLVAFFTSAALPVSQDREEGQFEASVLLLDARGTQAGAAIRGTQGVSLDTIAIFATLDDVAERAAERLHTDQDPHALAGSIEASADTETGIMTIKATARRGGRAERVAKAFALSLTDYLNDQRKSDLRRQITVLQQQIDELPANDERGSTTRANLVSRIADLNVQLATPLGLPILDTPEAVAVDATGLTAPTSGASRVVIGAILGLLGGIALALVLERMDRKVTNWRVAEELLPYPLLAEIPRIRRSRSLAVVDRPMSREADAFRLLASSALHVLEDAQAVHPEGNGHAAIPETPMLAITSAVRSEGKSLIAANLAAALGEMGKSVIVMSADLRSPTIHRYFDAPATPGVVDAIFDWDGVPGFRRICHATKAPGVSLIPGGSRSERPAAVLADEDLEKLLRYARAECDVLILDTPAILLSGDAVPLIRRAEGVLLVARAGKTSIDATERVSETLERVGASVVGFALNGTRSVGASWRSSPYRIAKDLPTVTPTPAHTSAVEPADSSARR